MQKRSYGLKLLFFVTFIVTFLSGLLSVYANFFMAKQVGPIFLVGTFGGVHFYKMGDDYYVRMQSSLDGKTVKTSPRFRNTMKYAQMMACSSRIGSVVFKALPARFKESWMYRAFVGEAMEMFKTERPYEEVFEVLWKRYAAEFQEGYDEMMEFGHGVLAMEGMDAASEKAKTVKRQFPVYFNRPLYTQPCVIACAKRRLLRRRMRVRDRSPGVL